jgi:hypothetical protein
VAVLAADQAAGERAATMERAPPPVVAVVPVGSLRMERVRAADRRRVSTRTPDR